MNWFWKQKRAVENDVSFFEYDIVDGTLIVTLQDGSRRVHGNVKQGYVIGLKTAGDKIDYYRSQIQPAFLREERD